MRTRAAMTPRDPTNQSGGDQPADTRRRGREQLGDVDLDRGVGLDQRDADHDDHHGDDDAHGVRSAPPGGAAAVRTEDQRADAAGPRRAASRSGHTVAALDALTRLCWDAGRLVLMQGGRPDLALLQGVHHRQSCPGQARRSRHWRKSVRWRSPSAAEARGRLAVEPSRREETAARDQGQSLRRARTTVGRRRRPSRGRRHAVSRH